MPKIELTLPQLNLLNTVVAERWKDNQQLLPKVTGFARECVETDIARLEELREALASGYRSPL